MTAMENIPMEVLIPQREPFVLVDKLTVFDRELATTTYHVKKDTMFCHDEVLDHSAYVENMAQTCAARLGYVNYLNRQTVKLGFIGSVRNMHIYRSARVGETLVTTIRQMEEVMQLSLVHATITIGDELVAEAEMKIAITNIDSK